MTSPSAPVRRPNFRDFYRLDSPDLLDKCKAFHHALATYRASGVYQATYRVTLTGALDHRVTALDRAGRERELICFDSNSYLHLHRHPRVVAAVHRALDDVGYGTPSAQLLCGTNRYLRELEDTLSAFHGREAAVVFSSGYAANVGTISALVRGPDLVFRDNLSHTSIHDGCRASSSRWSRSFPHRDTAALDRMLAEAGASPDAKGKLIVSDGVFSMHGRLAQLPELVRVARAHGATLMLDEAHATGVVGPSGRGTEEHFGLEGSADILMGTFSKAPGTVGGYVTGSRELCDYLRFYAHSAVFTAALPAALCAGVTESFRVMQQEPEHRQRLWRNVQALAQGLRQVGLAVPAEQDSAIIALFVGDDELLWTLGQELFETGIKVGLVAFPAVPPGEAIIRLTVNTRHTAQDIERTVSTLERLGRTHGILGLSRGAIAGRASEPAGASTGGQEAA